MMLRVASARNIKSASKITVPCQNKLARQFQHSVDDIPLTEKDLVVRDGTVEATRELGDTVDGPSVDEQGGHDDANQKHLHLAVKALRLVVRAVVALVEG